MSRSAYTPAFFCFFLNINDIKTGYDGGFCKVLE